MNKKRLPNHVGAENGELSDEGLEGYCVDDSSKLIDAYLAAPSAILVRG